MRNSIKNLVETLRNDIAQKNYKKVLFSVCEILFLLILAIGAIWLIGNGIAQLTHFIKENLGLLIFLCILVYFGTIWIRGKQQQKQDALATQKSRELYEAELAHQQANDDSYRIIRDIMYKVLLDVSKNCNLAPPDDESSLNAPLHCIERDGAILYQYIAIKRGEVSIRTIIALINSRISQLAEEKKLGFDPSMVMVLGKLYPAVLLDTATDCSNYVQLSIAPVTENYIKQRIDRDRHKNQPPFMKNGNDHDF